MPVLLAMLMLNGGSVAASSAAAPDTPPGGLYRTASAVLEEIVVSARRRDESWLVVPMAVTSLDGEILDRLQYRRVADFLSLSPGVVVYGGGDGVSSGITIRGVVSPGELIEPGNAVYVDEVYVSGMRTVLPGFYDIESVQVLKGPQAGLYGRNTMGGAVLITTGRPTDEQFARIDASYAQFGAKDINSTVNLPLSNSMRLRATGWYNDRDGGYYQNDILDQNLDTSSEKGGRVTLAMLPGRNTALALTGELSKAERPDFTGFDGMVEGARLAPAPQLPEARRNILRDDISDLELDSARINARFDHDTRVGSFIAAAGWREIEVRDPGADFDGTAWAASYADYLENPSEPLTTFAPQISARKDRDTSLNAELRYIAPDSGGPFRIQLGASYFEEGARLSGQVTPVRDFALILDAIGQDGNFARRVKQDNISWAGFTELIWTPLAKVEITADLRYTHDHKDFDFAQYAGGFYARPGTPDITLDTARTFENWSPGITLSYLPNDALTAFGKYVRGFRAGGFNMLANDPSLLPYDSEEAENYELGFKTLLLNGRLMLGASLFYLRIDNALVPLEDPGELATFYPLQNAGVGETTGLEVDLGAQLTDELSLTASAGGYDNTFSDGGPIGGDKRAFAPDYTASLAMNYEQPLTATVTGIATLGFRHRSGGRVPATYEIGMDSYNLVDAELGIRFNKLTLSGFVQNALDDNYVVGNYGLALVQLPYVAASGLNPTTTRAIVRNPGRVLGVRMTLAL